MFIGKSYLDVLVEIDPQGFPVPKKITLEGGRRLTVKDVMERKPVNTSQGVQAYRYEVWIDDATHILYLENTVPLRWYMNVTLPFQAPAQREEGGQRPAVAFLPGGLLQETAAALAVQKA